LTSSLIETNRERREIKDPSWYDTALSDPRILMMGFGTQYEIRLLYRDTLPDKTDVDLMLKHGVHGSRTLNITSTGYSPETARGIMDAIYAGLAEPSAIESLPDIYDDVLKSYSFRPIAALHEGLHRAAVSQARAPQGSGGSPKIEIVS
jgi:hypothetical protein